MADGICHGCSNNTLSDCLDCVKDGDSSCNIWNVIKDLIERVETLEAA
jgi:hypothetical protein